MKDRVIFGGTLIRGFSRCWRRFETGQERTRGRDDIVGAEQNRGMVIQPVAQLEHGEIRRF